MKVILLTLYCVIEQTVLFLKIVTKKPKKTFFSKKGIWKKKSFTDLIRD